MAAPAGDRLAEMIVINTLGFFDNPLEPAPPGGPPITAQAIREALASGMTAVNLTIGGSADFEATVRNLARHEAFLRS